MKYKHFHCVYVIIKDYEIIFLSSELSNTVFLSNLEPSQVCLIAVPLPTERLIVNVESWVTAPDLLNMDVW